MTGLWECLNKNSMVLVGEGEPCRRVGAGGEKGESTGLATGVHSPVQGTNPTSEHSGSEHLHQVVPKYQHSQPQHGF